ncbi:MAG: tetratricopeptide repeat protein [Desulfobulbaceae bacterium]|nr:tetratricopeptide repeat protein [Desulfobulbaceae bacterium]
MVSIQGEIHVRRNNQINWSSVSLDEEIYPGDMLRTSNNSRAAVVLINESILRINQKSTLFFPEQETEQPFLLKVINGVIHIFSHRPRALKVITPFVNGAVEGTEFLVQVDPDKASISVFKGLVAAFNKHGRLDISSGQTIVAEKDAAPKYLAVIRPRDATHWTLYYPEIIESSSSPSDTDSAPSFVRKAADQLAVGQVKEAQANIAKALEKEPGNSDGLALQAIIMIVQNQKEKALSHATKAVEIDPQSPSANMALSYALQANFDINGALTTLQNASSSNPGNALIKARLAELWLSVGELEKALSTAQEAVDLNSDIGRTQTVLGFAYLTQIKTVQAQAAFKRAITLDQALPLARLGLGLAKIRNGDLEEGRSDIEIAAALDPGNSLIRSYLGKSFYEEKRDKRAQEH